LDEDIRQLNEATLSDEYPLRLVLALSGHSGTPGDIAQRAKEIAATRNDKLRLGLVKLMTDGSIQGFTAQLKWPGYYRGPNHGIWNIAPEALFDMVDTLNSEGLQVHVHVNGDAASELAIKAFAKALTHHPRPDHRHTLQHCQMADRSQFHQMAALRLGVNLFANHIFFFGDQHRDITMGPERASRMDACRTALDEGVNLSIHSDAPVTPMGPLTVAWCAANRLTGSGQVLGPMERITLDEAMRAITLGPARSLHLDQEIGSIESGKRADFAILDADPYEVGAAELNKINVLGTMVGGTAFTDL
ncbi:MAG TPA: amidohydrolase family protein, partial [Arenicellales bacterium]|nr:amidohydrolase family protein [Arenicellales bacterium]